jgi:hypothetical protein
VRQNYLVPLPEVRDYAQLNTWLRERSLQDDQRQVSRQQKSIGAMWADEQPYLRSLPATDLSFFSQNPIAKLVALANSFVLCTFHNICIRVF